VPWRGWDNAEIYDRFVRERPIYRCLNDWLVERAEVREARRVLDLGCGTGATTEACLRVLGPEAEIVGVDASPEMIAVARANVADPRASFWVGGAGGIDRLPDGTFDRALSNAAFWQFPSPGAVLGRLASRLGPRARFAFNVPAERVAGRAAPVHPFQVALAREIELATGRAFAGSPSRLDEAAVAALAAERGFRVAAADRLTYRGTQDELVELMTIPAMIDPLVPELPPERREPLVRRAGRRVDPAEPVEVPWVYFVLERNP